jgi:nucleotide-binding universal stress UspA family protein
VSTIVIGVDASERSEDAIAFGRRLADAASATAIVACAFPYHDTPGKPAIDERRDALRDEALETAHAMCDRLGAPEERTSVRVMANPSPAHALHDLAEAERASLVVVGSTHRGGIGRVLPGSTAERLMHGAPCSLAVVPLGYREHADKPIRKIGVAYDGSTDAAAAVNAAVDLARAFDAEIEVVGVASADMYATPALMAAPSVVVLLDDIERHIKESIDEVVAKMPEGVKASGVVLRGGDAAQQIAERSSDYDILVCGSRGYGPLRSVLVGGVSGRLVRNSQCPVIVVPRGVEAPLQTLFDSTSVPAA